MATPMYPAPYPDRPWRRITSLRFDSRMVLVRDESAVLARSGADALYVVGAPYRVTFLLDGEAREIVVPRGLCTDLASVPQFAWALVDRVGAHLEAAIVHDYLYVAWQDFPGRGPRKADKRFADAIILAGMIAADVNPIRREIVYSAVRLFGWGPYSSPDAGRYIDLGRAG